jgi:hypothetical protein
MAERLAQPHVILRIATLDDDPELFRLASESERGKIVKRGERRLDRALAPE